MDRNLDPFPRLSRRATEERWPVLAFCMVIAWGLAFANCPPAKLFGQDADGVKPAADVSGVADKPAEKPQDKGQDKPVSDIKVNDSAVVEAKPITEDEANDFADILADAVLKGEFETCSKLIDWNEIVDKATATPKSPQLDAVRAKFREGSANQLKKESGMFRRIHDEIKIGGSYKCLRVDVKNSEPFAMFRYQLANDKGLNYHRFFLKRTANGGIIASDIYVFLTAERISETLRRNWTPYAQSQLRTSLERFLLPKDPYVANVEPVGKFAKLVSSQKSEEAMELYRKLPAIVQREKSVLVFRIMATQSISDTEYIQAIDDFRKYHPDDLATDFLLIGGYRARMKFTEALECLDRFSKTIDGDPMLLVMRAQLLLPLKRNQEAKKAVEDAIISEPELRDAYFTAADVSLAEQNFDDTVKYLTILETQFGQVWKDLREVPAFEEFVMSNQYRKWAETHQK